MKLVKVAVAAVVLSVAGYFVVGSLLKSRQAAQATIEPDGAHSMDTSSDKPLEIAPAPQVSTEFQQLPPSNSVGVYVPGQNKQ